MNIYKKYTTPFGYVADGNQVDAYGVDHSGFSTRDELEYQFARQERENQLTESLKQQGIEPENYPQLGNSFWGNNPEDNYGFGTSNISANIENRQNQYTNSALFPKSMANDDMVYNLAQNTNHNTASDVTTPAKPNIIFDDVYYSELGKNGNVIYQGTNYHEGGYSDRINDLGGPTNYGITQDSLDEYNNWNSPLKTGFNFSKDVEKLPQKQAKQIMDEMYYQRYNINKLQNLKLARNTFDTEVNQGTDAGKMLSRAMNEFYGYQKGASPKYFYENQVVNDTLANAVNKLTPEETVKVNDILAKLRMEKYFQSVDKNPIQNVNNINGWYNRAKSYYSHPQDFEKLYKNRVDDYIKNKYPQYYNGR